jgi:hypothetical protein
MVLCDMKGKFLYEVKPSLFPEGELTETEIQLWAMFYEEKNNRKKK